MENEKVFLQLVRLGIGKTNNVSLPDVVNWKEIKALADKQGLSAVLVDGIERLPDNQGPPQDLLLQWIGEMLQTFEYRYETCRKSIAELARFYNSNGFKMMVLKGYACSLNWPKPEHRPCGDIDIWQFGDYKEADALLSKEKGIKIDKTHHHHTVFYWHGFMVENHYDFLDTSIRKSSLEQEQVLKVLGTDDSHSVSLYGEKVYIPSPNLHALFLIRHMVDHFASVSINIRQLLDWAFYIEHHTQDIDWEWLRKIIEKYKLLDFVNCLNAICVENLGFESAVFNGSQFNPLLKEKILNDTLNPKYETLEPKNYFKRLVYIYKRWQGNKWKQKLCYSENRLLIFFTTLRSHLIKPKLA